MRYNTSVDYARFEELVTSGNIECTIKYKGEDLKLKAALDMLTREIYFRGVSYNYFVRVPLNALHKFCEENKLEFLDPKTMAIITGDTSDGYHTFNELYRHRTLLFATLCNLHQDIAWKSKHHSDGTMFENMFIAGVDTPQGQATYHCEMEHWEDFKVKELEKAPEWDGHTADEAIERITHLSSDVSAGTSVEVQGAVHPQKLTEEVFNLPECPEWAQYAAVDRDGRAFWYGDVPNLDLGCFISDHSHVQIEGVFSSNNWLDSLIRRPSPADVSEATTVDKPEGEVIQKLTTEVFNRLVCPDWARYAAIDLSGNAYWYEKRPKVVVISGCFASIGRCKRIEAQFCRDENWHNSVICRPPWSGIIPWSEEEAVKQVGKQIRFKGSPLVVTILGYCEKGLGGFLFPMLGKHCNVKFMLLSEVAEKAEMLDGSPCGTVRK